MLTRLHAKLLTKPELWLHPLGIEFRELVSLLGDRGWQESESDWTGCTDCVVDEERYKLIATIDAGIVVGYIHDTGVYREKPAERLRKLNECLDFYGSKSELGFVVDNGFGYLYRSKDAAIRAAYSYVADIFSVSYSRLERKQH